jgi:hypothetical protein
MRSSVDLPEPEGPSKSHDFSGIDGQIGRRNHLDADIGGLRVVFFHLLGANDGRRHAM